MILSELCIIMMISSDISLMDSSLGSRDKQFYIDHFLGSARGNKIQGDPEISAKVSNNLREIAPSFFCKVGRGVKTWGQIALLDFGSFCVK